MKRLILGAVLGLLLMTAAGAVTEEDVREVGGDRLTEGLSSEQRSYLDGIRPETAENLHESIGQLLNNMASDSRGALSSAIHSLVRVSVVIVLTAAARGVAAPAGGEINAVIDMAGALGCAAVLLYDFTGVLTLCRQTLEQISVFSAALQPVLATVLSAGGSAATATALQLATMIVFDVVIRLVNTLLVPAACAYLSMIAVDAATGGELLYGMADGIRSLVSGALKLILTLFTAYLAVAGGISGNVDRTALKTAKFALSGAVPVVGGVISDATEAMLSGAALLKNSVGVFGMLCVTAVCVVPFLRAGASYLCYRAGAAALSPLCSSSLRQLLAGVGTGFGLLLGMLSTCCIILYLELVYVVAMVRPV